LIAKDRDGRKVASTEWTGSTVTMYNGKEKAGGKKSTVGGKKLGRGKGQKERQTIMGVLAREVNLTAAVRKGIETLDHGQGGGSWEG